MHFYNLTSPYLKGNEKKYLLNAFTGSWISSKGKYIEIFENEFAKYIGVKNAIAVSNGTSALHLSLMSLNIKKGDEVIIPDLTFAATINAVLYVGATPVIVDIERDSWCISPKEIEKALSNNTKAIIPVHIYGQPANMSEILKFAKMNNLYIVEDCAEALGAEYRGKKVGSIGDIGCFSFYGNKIITTGEGGMCVTNDDMLAAKIRILRDHGMTVDKRYWHEVIGFNYRMTNLQAAIGLAQLKKINFIIHNRKIIEKFYRKELEKIDYFVPQRDDLDDRKKVTWLVSFLIQKYDRDLFRKKLLNYGVDTRPFFYPLSKMNIYKNFLKSKAPIAEEISAKGINLPTDLNLNKSDYYEILNRIKKSILF